MVHRVRVRILKTSVVIAAMLATTHAFGTLPVPQTSNLQAAEAADQETINLAVSGMV